MTQDPIILQNQIRQLQSRLRSLGEKTKAARKAQQAHEAMPKVISQELRNDFLNASKKAEKDLDAFLKQLEYEKLIS